MKKFRQITDYEGDEPLNDRLAAERILRRVIPWKNENHYHRAFGDLRPLDYQENLQLLQEE